jgi:hypothetical protein
VLKIRLGAIPFAEPAEEMRLVLLQLLSTLLKRKNCEETLPDLMEDLCIIISTSLTDAFPDVKKECTSCVNLLAKAAPAEIRSHAPAIVKALIGNVLHQHSKVRQYTLQVRFVIIDCADVTCEDFNRF